MTRAVAVSFLWLIALCAGSAANEITVFSTRAFRPAFQALRPEFEHATGHKIAAKYGRGRVIRNYILSGHNADLVILLRPLILELVERRKILDASVVQIARTELGLGVKIGQLKTDASSPDGFKNALLAAKTIVCPDPRIGAASTSYFMQALKRLGIFDRIAPKIRIVSAEHTADYVARGEADLAVQVISELLAVPGIQAVPFPSGLETSFVFSAGVATGTREMRAANALLEFLTTPAAIDVIKEKNLQLE